MDQSNHPPFRHSEANSEAIPRTVWLAPSHACVHRGGYQPDHATRLRTWSAHQPKPSKNVACSIRNHRAGRSCRRGCCGSSHRRQQPHRANGEGRRCHWACRRPAAARQVHAGGYGASNPRSGCAIQPPIPTAIPIATPGGTRARSSETLVRQAASETHHESRPTA